jgi:hypothetical protein
MEFDIADDEDDLQTLFDLRNDIINDNLNVVIAAAAVLSTRTTYPRSAALFRHRWNCEYLVDLATRENSFVAEYRLDPAGFDQLVQMLTPALEVDQKMAAIAMSSSYSQRITEGSRLGAALIILAGGRRIEAMRTHGLAETTVYSNLKRVVRAINSHSELAVSANKTCICM